MQTACISGITGRTGSYICDLLLTKGYKVYGLKRRSSSLNTERIDHVYSDPHANGHMLEMIYGDLTDYSSLSSWIGDIKPDLFFNMAAQSITENSILPILTSLGIEHVSFEELWNRYSGEETFTTIDGIETEIITIKNKQLQGLGYWNGMGTWSRIKQITRHKYNGKIIRLSQKFGSIETTLNHCIFDTQQKICSPINNPWLLNVRKLNYFDTAPISSFRIKLPGNNVDIRKDDNFMWIVGGTDSGKIKHQLEGNSLLSFCRFLAAFVSEGHTTFNVANNSYLIGISNQNKNWLMDLEKNLLTFFDGSSCFIRHKKDNFDDVWELQIRSEVLYRWLRKHCGFDSTTKKIPNFLFSCSQLTKTEFFNILRQGDGCLEYRKTIDDIFRYTTASYKLACQLSLLFTTLGYDYTVNIENGENDKKYYHFRQCLIYQPNQGRDGKKIEYIDYNGYVYDISIENLENFAVGVGNIIVHNSHVRVSFDIPEYTMDVTGTGVIRVLEAIHKNSPKTKFLTASSSEMFGSEPPPQNEQTPFHPRSPYGVAKVAGYYTTVNYREAYGLHACNAISFNHECLSSNTPIIVRVNGMVDVVSAKELIPLKRKGSNIQTFDIKGAEIWDGKNWTSLKTITATKYKGGKDQKLISIQARAGIVEATSHHNMLNQDMQEKRADSFISGDRVALSKNFPPIENWTVISEEMAEFLGFLVSEGHISDHKIQFTNNNEIFNKRVTELWSKLFMGETYAWLGKSGFNPEKSVGQMNLNGCPSAIKWLHSQIYNSYRLKKVPPLVLNSTLSIQKAFLKGYYAGDGLKAGNGESIKTNSSFLAQGLCWIYFNTGNYCSTYVEHRNNECAYYQLNILTDSKLGQHLRKEPSEIRKIEDAIVFDDWVFDVETGSSVLMAGIGRTIVHNSPRRGETFVTRKITRAATRIKLGLQDKLYLGNLDAMRDWSHAADVAEGMYKIITAPQADDFVIASGEMHSVKEFAQLVFGLLGLDWTKYVEFDARYLRPSEVDALCGDSSKIRNQLGWTPSYSFLDLVQEMVNFDMELARKEKTIKDHHK